jgi:hypothetical protein
MALVTVVRQGISPGVHAAVSAQHPAGGATPRAAGTAAPASVDAGHLWFGVGILIAGAAAGAYFGQRAAPIALKPGINVFGVFYILAQALERLFELLQMAWPSLGRAKTDGQTTAKAQAVDARDEKLAVAINTGLASDATAAAAAQAVLDQIRANRSLLAWTINSAIAMAACGLLGLRLIGAISDPAWPHPYLDVILTGLVIGGGTKPLHDLIANLQAAKKTKEDPQANGSTGA